MLFRSKGQALVSIVNTIIQTFTTNLKITGFRLEVFLPVIYFLIKKLRLFLRLDLDWEGRKVWKNIPRQGVDRL